MLAPIALLLLLNMLWNTVARPPRRRRRPPIRAVQPEQGRMALTVNEAAWFLHSHPNHVANLIKRGELESFALGRKRLVARAAIEELIARGGTSGGDAA